ncbi:tetratricopeptide repeat protein [Streptomyces sp. NBC_00663]
MADRGQAHAVRDRLKHWHDAWSQQLSPDHEGALWTAHYLARAYDGTQDHERALALHEDTLTRRRRLYGGDHLNTLASVSPAVGTFPQDPRGLASRPH